MEDEVVTEEQQQREAAPPDPPDEPVAARRLRRVPIVPLVMAVLLAAVLAEALLLFRSNDQHARAEVLTTSRRFLGLLTTYNSATLDAQRREVLALATGRFKGEYEQVTGSGFLSTLRERSADSKGTVDRASVESVAGDSATVLAVVTVSVTNKDIKTPATEQDLIELSLVRTRSGWRIDSVTILGRLTA